jgi:hypothetical protein
VGCYLAEFSIPSAIERFKPLQQMTRSASKHDRAIIDRLLKTSIVLMAEVERYGPYKDPRSF